MRKFQGNRVRNDEVIRGFRQAVQRVIYSDRVTLKGLEEECINKFLLSACYMTGKMLLRVAYAVKILIKILL